TVTVTADAGQVRLNYPDPPSPITTNDLGVLSGELGNPGFSTDTVSVVIEPTDGVPQAWTTEWIVLLESVPADFSDVFTNHIYLGSSDSSGPVAGILISATGIAYTGSVHFSGNNIVLDAPVQTVPNTAQYITLGDPVVIRLAADGAAGLVYLFVTPKTDVLT